MLNPFTMASALPLLKLYRFTFPAVRFDPVICALFWELFLATAVLTLAFRAEIPAATEWAIACVFQEIMPLSSPRSSPAITVSSLLIFSLMLSVSRIASFFEFKPVWFTVTPTETPLTMSAEALEMPMASSFPLIVRYSVFPCTAAAFAVAFVSLYTSRTLALILAAPADAVSTSARALLFTSFRMFTEWR